LNFESGSENLADATGRRANQHEIPALHRIYVMQQKTCGHAFQEYGGGKLFAEKVGLWNVEFGTDAVSRLNTARQVGS